MKIKIMFYFFALIVMVPSSLFGMSPQKIFDEAKKAIEEGNLDAGRNAIEALNDMANKATKGGGYQGRINNFKRALEEKLATAAQRKAAVVQVAAPPAQQAPSVQQPKLPVQEAPTKPSGVGTAVPVVPAKQPVPPPIVQPRSVTVVTTEPVAAPSNAKPINTESTVPGKKLILKKPGFVRPLDSSIPEEWLADDMNNQEPGSLCAKDKDFGTLDFYFSAKKPLVSDDIKNKLTDRASAPLIGQYGNPYNLCSPLIFIENDSHALQNVPLALTDIVNKKSIPGSDIDFFTIVWGEPEEKSISRMYNVVFHQVVRDWLRDKSDIEPGNFSVTIDMGLFAPQGVTGISIAVDSVKKEQVIIHPGGNGMHAFSPNNARFEVDQNRKIVSFWSVAFSPDSSRVMIIYNVMAIDSVLAKDVDRSAVAAKNLQALLENMVAIQSSNILTSAEDKAVLDAFIKQLNEICTAQHSHEYVYLVPNENELKKLELCPPFKDLKNPPLYNNEVGGKLEPRYAGVVDVPCIRHQPSYVAYRGLVNQESSVNYQIDLLQLRTINQSTPLDIAQENQFVFTNECPTLSLRNALIMDNYAKTGSIDELKLLYDAQRAYTFIRDVGCLQRLEPDALRVVLALDPFKTLNRDRLFILDNPDYIDPKSDPNFRTEDENLRIEKMRNILAEGLKENSFYCTWIMGTGDERLKGVKAEHWYSVTLLKSGITLQYIVTDTLSHYHLQPGSYDLQRLEKIIAVVNSYLPVFDINRLAYPYQSRLPRWSGAPGLPRATRQ